MTKLPLIAARDMERLLLTLGFKRSRQRGSHVIFRHEDGRTACVPDHGSRVLARPLLRSILRDADISLEQFLHLLNDL
ncbi:MAG: type II toxin-antitoxin system HicA family toxin [bacterium]|nr:type II toxin-antitoxin system HicA family toxin [bacterium]